MKDYAGSTLKIEEDGAILVSVLGEHFCISHETKPNSSLFLSLILLSGDVCPNPGPHNALDLCGICTKSVKSNQRGICCDLCNIWFHVRRQCVNMRLESYRSHADNIDLQWICNVCLELPTNESEANISVDDSNPNMNSSTDEFTAINNNRIMCTMGGLGRYVD